jgi:hypothetical protein
MVFEVVDLGRMEIDATTVLATSHDVISAQSPIARLER